MIIYLLSRSRLTCHSWQSPIVSKLCFFPSGNAGFWWTHNDRHLTGQFKPDQLKDGRVMLINSLHHRANHNQIKAPFVDCIMCIDYREKMDVFQFFLPPIKCLKSFIKLVIIIWHALITWSYLYTCCMLDSYWFSWPPYLTLVTVDLCIVYLSTSIIQGHYKINITSSGVFHDKCSSYSFFPYTLSWLSRININAL